MNVEKMIKELEKMGFKVSARRRTDGGWIITKINDMSFTGASGNQYARQVLGVELSQARIEQTHFNVNKYIKLKEGQHKAKGQIDEDLNKELRKVQRQWQKKNVHARITKKKLRWHLKEGGKEEAKKYLQRMSRYGQGYAYEENVEYLAKYIRDVAKKISDKELQEAALRVADIIMSKVATFLEAWIEKVYSYWYEVIESGYNGNTVSQAIMSTMNLIG